LLEKEREEALRMKGVKTQVWRVKPSADDRQDPGSSTTPINMVFMLPREFMASENDEEEPELEEAMA